MRYRFLLIAATVIWGSSFVVVKDVASVIAPAWLLVIRFTLAAAILIVALLPRRCLYLEHSHMLYGVMAGLAFLTAYLLQTIGITGTTPGKNAFLTAVYCAIVPFVSWIMMKQRPTRFNFAAVVLCLVGIGLISLGDDLTLGWGDALSLSCSVFYALQIVIVAKYGPGRDIYVLTMWQFITVSAGCLVFGLLFEKPPVVAALASTVWVQMLYLSIAVTVLGILFQNVGQMHVPPATAGLLLSFESVFGALFSVLLGTEQLTGRLITGFILVFAAVLVSEYLPAKLNRRCQPAW